MKSSCKHEQEHTESEISINHQGLPAAPRTHSLTAWSLLFLASLILLSGEALGQTGRILGTVRDESGGLIPGAEVTATNQATAVARSFTTGDTGNYEFPNLAVGSYLLRVQMPGFNVTETRVRVEGGRMVRQDFRLLVGQIANVVTVRAGASLLQTDTSEVSQVITNKQVVELPLNGRLYTSLALLVPGVTTRGGGSAQFGFGGNVSVNGSRGGSENYMVDGVTTNASANRQPQIAPSLEAIQEFQIATSTFNAEQGRGSAVFNLIIRSGTNDFHGSVYEFWRNDSLAANDFFQNQLEDPDSIDATLKRNQFGAVLGGPIVKNRTFFFAHYEGERLRQGEIVTSRVPTDLERAGDFSQSQGVSFITDPLTGEPFPDLRVPRDRFHPVYNYFQSWWPGPNTADGFLIAAPKTSLNGDQVGFKIDHVFSDRDDVFFRYYFARRDNTNPGVGTEPFTLVSDRIAIDSHQLVGHWNHSFSPGVLFDLQYSRIEFDSLRVDGPNCFQADGCTNHVVASGIGNMGFSSSFYPGSPTIFFGGGGWAPLGGGEFPLRSDLPHEFLEGKSDLGERQSHSEGRHRLLLPGCAASNRPPLAGHLRHDRDPHFGRQDSLVRFPAGPDDIFYA